jgi:hypothetical protein
MKIHNIIILSSILTLTSCAFQSKDKWVKNNSNERDYIIADSSCTAESYKAAPAIPASNCGPESSFSHGYCMGSQIGNARKMKDIRVKVYDGCMFEKGWEKKPIQ